MPLRECSSLLFVVVPTFPAMADADPPNRRMIEQIVVAVATFGATHVDWTATAEMRSRGTTKSAVSRRFVAKASVQRVAWETRSLRLVYRPTLPRLITDWCGRPIQKPRSRRCAAGYRGADGKHRQAGA